MLTRSHIITLIIVAAITVVGAWIYAHIEFYDKEDEVGFQGEARRNPFFAAGRLMERFGATVHHQPVYTRLPPPGATLVLPTERRTLSKARSEELLSWVKAGGHLVVVTWTLWREGAGREVDFLLDPLSVRQFENEAREPDPDEKKPPARKKATRKQQIRKPQAANIIMPHEEGVLQARFDKRFRLEDASGKADWKLADEAGTHALHYLLGKGSVTVLSDHGFMHNRQIGNWDHAALLYRLVNPKAGREIWVIYSDDVPALWHWLVEHAWAALVSALLLLAAWLWTATRRLGPIIPPPARERRSMVEHITASGRFLWQQKSSPILYQAVVEALMRQIRIRHPQWAAMSKDEFARQAASLAGLPWETVSGALKGDLPRNEEQFAQDIHTIETLKTRL